MSGCPNCGYVPDESEDNPEWRRIDSHVTVDRDPMAEQEEARLVDERAKTEREPFEIALLRRRSL